ncbi:AAA family ATPase [Salinigranum rubrum]|uniref:AAA family ATPase n=1 Tax=Salinigranum rubrum TaxID=755307 RepID=UPI001FE38800|nr:AAA family ATPase [Salinigranum rubrum]
MSVTVVSGVPGVGSSRVTEAAVASLDERFELLNSGDVMLEEALGSGRDVEGRDDLSGLSPTELRRLQRRMGEYVAAVATDPDTHVVLNTHLVVSTSAGFVPGLPPRCFENWTPTRSSSSRRIRTSSRSAGATATTAPIGWETASASSSSSR